MAYLNPGGTAQVKNVTDVPYTSAGKVVGFNFISAYLKKNSL